MRGAICRAIDRATIRAAAASLPPEERDGHIAEATQLIADPAFMAFPAPAPVDFRLRPDRSFQFTSAVRSPWHENNIVHGRLYQVGQKAGQTSGLSGPATILLHGWNGETGYYWQFPYLARRLNRYRVNAVMLELPYHAQRKPSQPGAVRNFISRDLLRMVEATRQALADIRALSAWLRSQGATTVGVWGVSLGAWFGGLAASYDPGIEFAAFLSPVVRMDQAVHELDFCAPIRHSLAGHDVCLDQFNLASHPPAADPRKVLIVESIYDVFAPASTIEQLWEAWGRPEIWRERHGHISILASLPILERVVRWIACATKG
jgi:pimeloyl-ACP methyl ester carboxylesterase